ncbi:MAG: DUF917 domain-containing protein [Candidatus Heimdallarchaeaceae archaeon]|jgi:DUF917 family protein
MTIKKLSKREALDLVIGAKILACGGGGSEERAIENINRIYDSSKFFTIADLADFNDEDKICIIGMVGGGISEEDTKLVEDLKVVLDEPMITAVKELEEFQEQDFGGFVATELGPNNSIVPLMVAAQMGKIAVDGDCCGRSKPKISISTTRVAGIPIYPLSIISKYGDVQIVKQTVDDSRGELIARKASCLSGGSVSVARCPMTIEQAKGAVIPGTFSLAIELGRNVREANENKQNPIDTILRSVPEIKRIYEGEIESFSRSEEGGFTSGKIIIKPQDEDRSKLQIWYQNEYLLSWLNREQFVTSPDGIYIVDSVTGYGLTPWEEDFRDGRQVTVLAKEAPQMWKSEKGLQIFGPKAFDENCQEYKPLSDFNL